MDKENVKKILSLSKFDIKISEKVEKDFLKIVKWVEKINELEIENVETPEFFKKTLHLREDQQIDFHSKENIVKNFPESQNNLLIVPEVLKSE